MITDLRVRYRKCVRVALFAFLLITPTQSLQAPKGCVEVASALAKNPSMDALSREPNFLPNAVKCLQETIKLTGEADWQTVQATMPPEVKEFIRNAGLKFMRQIVNVKAYATGAGFVFMSLFLLYKGTELWSEAKHLALEYKKFQEDFELIQEELTQILSFIDTEMVRQCKTGNTARLENIEKLSEKLSRPSTILVELVNKIHYNAKKCESDKVCSVGYGVLAAGVCLGAICWGNPLVFAPVCVFTAGQIVFSYITYTTHDETLKKSARLRQDAMAWRKEITKYRVTFDNFKTKLELK